MAKRLGWLLWQVYSWLLFLQAPGEAEAELAYLNSIGQIDAVLSDDVDTFLFGATMVIRKSVMFDFLVKARL